MRTINIGDQGEFEVEYKINRARLGDDETYEIVKVQYWIDELQIWIDVTNVCSHISDLITREVEHDIVQAAV